MSRIYVAGKWEEKDRVRQVQEQLKAAGHTITYDWTRANGDNNAVGSRQAFAMADRSGVFEADVFVGVFEKDLKYIGALTEMGMAVAMDIPIYILGNSIDSNIFLELPEVRRGIQELLAGEVGRSA